MLSLLPDMPWLFNLQTTDTFILSTLGARATKVTQVGAQAGRIVRIARIASLVRVIKVHILDIRLSVVYYTPDDMYSTLVCL